METQTPYLGTFSEEIPFSDLPTVEEVSEALERFEEAKKQEIYLHTESGDYIARATIYFNCGFLPDSVNWGDRVFVQGEEEDPVYFEATPCPVIEVKP